MTRRRGVTRWLNRLKGFGFIESDFGHAEVFIHYSSSENKGFEELYQQPDSSKSKLSEVFKGFKLR